MVGRRRWWNCVAVPYFVEIGQTVAEIWRFFEAGGRTPSWICVARVWTTQRPCNIIWHIYGLYFYGTTHEKYLVVFIAVQNFVGIGVEFLNICEFQYYASLA